MVPLVVTSVLASAACALTPLSRQVPITASSISSLVLTTLRPVLLTPLWLLECGLVVSWHCGSCRVDMVAKKSSGPEQDVLAIEKELMQAEFQEQMTVPANAGISDAQKPDVLFSAFCSVSY